MTEAHHCLVSFCGKPSLVYFFDFIRYATQKPLVARLNNVGIFSYYLDKIGIANLWFGSNDMFVMVVEDINKNIISKININK